MSTRLPVMRKEATAKICRAIEEVRVSRAATQHAIEQSRRSLGETHALLVALRLQFSHAPPAELHSRRNVSLSRQPGTSDALELR
jgi:hypothetical protein